jgi:hypothetical protein
MTVCVSGMSRTKRSFQQLLSVLRSESRQPSFRTTVRYAAFDPLRVWISPGRLLICRFDCLSRRVVGFPSSELNGQVRDFFLTFHTLHRSLFLSLFSLLLVGSVNHYPHFTVGNMKRSLDVVAYTGEPIARLFDPEVISAVPAVSECRLAPHSSR